MLRLTLTVHTASPGFDLPGPFDSGILVKNESEGFPDYRDTQTSRRSGPSLGVSLPELGMPESFLSESPLPKSTMPEAPPANLAPFTIYVDADACPRAIKEVFFKAAIKQRIPLIMVANRWSETPKIRWFQSVVVEAGPDEADRYIAEKAQPGDLAITADIPLAAQLVDKGVTVIDHKGREFTQQNVKQLLGLRDFSAEMREAGIETAQHKPFSPKDREAFANGLNRCVCRLRG